MMKLDTSTMTVLQNFQTINESIAINPGNEIRTISPTGTVVAKAKVKDTFPIPFAIYDVSRFLGIASLFKDADFDFADKHLTIKSGASKVKYVYCEPENIITPPKKQISLPSVDVEFDLKSSVFTSVMRGMQVLGYTELAIIGEKGKLTLSAISLKNKTSDVYSVEIGETDKEFNVIIEADKLKILPVDYHVQISKQGISYFKADTIEYWIAISAASKFK